MKCWLLLFSVVFILVLKSVTAKKKESTKENFFCVKMSWTNTPSWWVECRTMNDFITWQHNTILHWTFGRNNFLSLHVSYVNRIHCLTSAVEYIASSYITTIITITIRIYKSDFQRVVNSLKKIYAKCRSWMVQNLIWQHNLGGTCQLQKNKEVLQ